MDLFKIIILIVILSAAFTLLERNYKVSTRYEYYKGFKNVVILGAIFSAIGLVAVEAIAKDYLKSAGLNVGIVEGILAMPLFFYAWIRTEVKQRELLRQQEDKKQREDKVDFCYYCGSELDEGNICPNCGKQLER